MLKTDIIIVGCGPVGALLAFDIDLEDLGLHQPWLILAGNSGLELLDSYGSEREKHVRYVIKMAVKIGKIIQAPNLALTLIRNATLWITEKLGLQMVPKSMSQQSIGPGFFSKSAIVPEKHRRPFPQPLVSHRQGGEPVLMDSHY